MALSQVQCLDNNNVNWRYNESKPEFFYSEEQRLALEALMAKGTDAFYEVLKKENIREFLSELELKKILDGVETYDPSTSHISSDCTKEGGEELQDVEEGMEDSLEYWPMKSDCSIPELDLGWPDTVAYRGVTRATVYMQPPLDGQPHIKEVVRKMITQAQKVIAVVMDMFTDVDIFKDMLDAGFKRKVAVYIILDETKVQYFLQMCERAQMHAGHLKNLRIRCAGGTEFYTRSTTKFKGALAQKFLFVDGDRAVCGAYSFTWSAARTDRNIITLLTGQVVEAFDKQFQELYPTSKGVSLKTVTIQNEPEQETFIQPVAVPVVPAPDVAKKLINPKYALVKAKGTSDLDVTSDNKCGSKDLKGTAKGAKQRLDVKEEMLSNIHPALQNMEKANMFDYLPTWVEPDPEPGSEVLGYINIVDPNVWNVQLSQMNRIKICDTSQATAQHMQLLIQQKELEAKREQDKNAAANPTVSHEKPKPPEGNKAHKSHAVGEQKAPESPKAKAPESPKAKAPESPKPQTLEVPENPKPQTLEVPESSKPQTPKSPLGAFALLANSQHLHCNENEASDPLKNGKGNQPPVPKPRTVPVADLILKNNAINESQSKTTDKQENKTNVQEEENQGAIVNGLHKVLGKTKSPCAQNGFVGNGKNDNEDDDEDEEYVTLSDQDSFSDCSCSTNQHKSNASSVSEEYYDLQDYYRPSLIRRRHSERLPNGEGVHLQRKMSDSHISRGTFVSPLKISQSMLEMRQEDETYMRRNKALEEEIKRALERSRKQTAVIKGIDRLHSNDSTQGRPFHHYTSRPHGIASTDHSDSHGQNREVNASRNDSYQRPSKNGDTSTDLQRFWNARPAFSGQQPRKGAGSSFLDTQVAADAMSTPFGIPYSKLSQSKHLKNRLAIHGVDLKRRGHKDQ